MVVRVSLLLPFIAGCGGKPTGVVAAAALERPNPLKQGVSVIQAGPPAPKAPPPDQAQVMSATLVSEPADTSTMHPWAFAGVPKTQVASLERSRSVLAAWGSYWGSLVTFSRWNGRSIGNRLKLTGNSDGSAVFSVEQSNVLGALGTRLAYDGQMGLTVSKGEWLAKRLDLADPAWVTWSDLLPLATWPGLLGYLEEGELIHAGERDLAGSRAETYWHRSKQLKASNQTEVVGFDPQTAVPRFIQREDAVGVVNQIVFGQLRRGLP